MLRSAIPLCLLAQSSIAFSDAFELPILDTRTCQVRGNYIYNCAIAPITRSLAQTYSYVPLETHITFNVSPYCTESNIVLSVDGDNQRIATRNIFSVAQFTLPQTHRTLHFDVSQPTGYYSALCTASAAIQTDVLNRPRLVANLTARKREALEALGLLEQLIESQSLVINLNAAVDALLAVIDTADADPVGGADFTELNHILDTACEAGTGAVDCTWESQVSVILDNARFNDWHERITLYQLGVALDNVQADACVGEHCDDGSLLDETTRAVIDSTQDQVPDDEGMQQQLAQNIAKKHGVDNQLAEYQQVAVGYNVPWDRL